MTRHRKWLILRALPASIDDETWYTIVELLDEMIKFDSVPLEGKLLLPRFL